MILIADSNVVISGLIKDGFTRQFLIDSSFTLYSPETLISEIKKHENLILEKSGLSREDFEILFNLLIEDITIVGNEEYLDKMENANELIEYSKK